MDEVHIPNAELRSSSELLTELQKAGGKSCLGKSKTGIQETGAAHVSSQTSIKESCADISAFLPAKRGKLFLPILRMEELCQ